VDDADRVVVLLSRLTLEDGTALPNSIGRIRIVTAIGGGGSSPATIARMYSMPVIVAPAAAVGTGSCQTRVRLRLVSGLDSAKASAASTAVPPSAATPSSLTWPLPAQARRRPAPGRAGWPDRAGPP
jgi:hypothetical protein